MKFGKTHRHEPHEPQLATMIDVFSILIIFLIAGTAMDSSILQIPSDIKLPATISDDTIINAPQITIQGETIWFSVTKQKYPLNLFSEANMGTQEFLDLKNVLTQALAENSKQSNAIIKNESADYLNLVAEKSTPYKDIFLVVKNLKDIGFKNIVFVGTVQKK